MAIRKFKQDESVAYVSQLPDEPNASTTGLTAAELKAVFDRAAVELQEYINNHLVPDIMKDIAAAVEGADEYGFIDGSRLNDDSIPTEKYANESITNPKLAKSCVATDNYQPESVDTNAMKKRSVTGDILGLESVGNIHLRKSSVGTDTVEDGAITEPKIFPASVGTTQLKKGSVTRTILAPDAMGGPVRIITKPDESFLATDLGGTVVTNGASTDFTITLTQELSSSLPNGAMFSALWLYAKSVTIKGEGVRFAITGDAAVRTSASVTITERHGVCGLMKLYNQSAGSTAGDVWSVQGMAEVAT